MTETTLRSPVSGSDAVSPAFLNRLNASLIHVKEDDVFQPKGIMIVIPAYNEEVTIGSVVLQARQYAEKIIVVDDGSADNTTPIAKMAGAEVISLEHNTGKAYALLLGLRRARELGCMAAIMMDADGQHHARDIPRMASLARNGEADLVIGSRFIDQKDYVPAYRRVGQKTLDFATNLGTKQNMSDSQSGFRALSRKALDYLDFKSDGYNVESDMISHFTANGLVLKEVPINVRYDVPNKHKKHPLTHGMGVLSSLVNLISYRRPLLAFGIPGLALIVGGMAAEVWVFEELRMLHVFHDVLAVGSAFVLVLGMLLMIAGLILNTLVIIVNDKR